MLGDPGGDGDVGAEALEAGASAALEPVGVAAVELLLGGASQMHAWLRSA